MSLTVMSAAREVLKAGDDASVEVVAKALSSGALRGARGNSGVIVSQLFRGMYRGLKGTEEIDAAAWANAMRQGVETAYKAVMRPKEGTILTVARGMAEAAVDAAIEEEDLAELLKLVDRARRRSSGEDAGYASGSEGSGRGGRRRKGTPLYTLR